MLLKEKKEDSVFKNFGPAFLILALGIGSGEFILWPYLTANYGFGILWGALLGITFQLFLINLISRNTIIFKDNILGIFAKVFSGIYFWIIFSTILGFGWPGFSSLTSELLVNGFGLDKSIFLPLSFFILIISALILILSKSAYKKILFLEKIALSLLLFLSLFLFIFYFDFEEFKSLILGFFGIGENYNFLPKNIEIGLFLTTFLGAIAYAGSGGNLLLGNSFYLRKENSKEDNSSKEIKKVLKQNLLFFWTGGILIISMLSYVSYIVLKNKTGLEDDFSFLILESHIFSSDISPFIGYLFILLGAAALFGVQLGIFDFIGRITKHGKNSLEKFKNKYSDKQAYNGAIIISIFFGLLIFLIGIDKPKSLIIIGAVINSLSMGVIALLLLLVEIKKVPEKFKSKWNILGLVLSTIFYLTFFIYVAWQNLF